MILPYHIAMDKAREVALAKKLLEQLGVVLDQLTKTKLLAEVYVLVIYLTLPYLRKN